MRSPDIAFFLLGWFSLANDRDETVHSAYIWLAGGIAVGVLWVLPPRRWAPVLVGLLAAMGGLIIEERSPAVPALAWTLAEIAGAVAAGLLLERFAGEARLDSLDKVWRFLVAGALAYALVGSLLGSAGFRGGLRQDVRAPNGGRGCLRTSSASHWLPRSS